MLRRFRSIGGWHGPGLVGWSHRLYSYEAVGSHYQAVMDSIKSGERRADQQSSTSVALGVTPRLSVTVPAGVQVEVAPFWKDGCVELFAFGFEGAGLTHSLLTDEDGASVTCSVQGAALPTSQPATILLGIPTMCDVEISSDGSDVRLCDKLMGDVAVHTRGGALIAKQLRGNSVLINTRPGAGRGGRGGAAGAVAVSGTVEATTLTVATQHQPVTMRKVLVRSASLEGCSSFAADAVYAATAALSAASGLVDIAVTTLHGQMSICGSHSTAGSNISVTGIVGAVDVKGGAADVTLQWDDCVGDSTLHTTGSACLSLQRPTDASFSLTSTNSPVVLSGVEAARRPQPGGGEEASGRASAAADAPAAPYGRWRGLFGGDKEGGGSTAAAAESSQRRGSGKVDSSVASAKQAWFNSAQSAAAWRSRRGLEGDALPGQRDGAKGQIQATGGSVSLSLVTWRDTVKAKAAVRQRLKRRQQQQDA